MQFSDVRSRLKPRMHDRLVSERAQIVAGTPAQFTAFIRSELPKIATILQQAGVKRGTY